MSGECNFLGSVLPQQRFEMVDQCYSSVTAQSFIQQTKDSTPFRHEGGPTIEEKPQSWLPLFCLLPPSLTCANWASQEGGVFVSPEVFTPIHGFSFCSIFVGFSLSLSFSHCHFGLLFSYSNYLIVLNFSLVAWSSISDSIWGLWFIFKVNAG